MKEKSEPGASGSTQTRRNFLLQSGLLALGSVSGIALLEAAGCRDQEEEEEITPSEDLMREHGVLNRVLLVYDHFLGLIHSKTAVNPQWLQAAAVIIKNFIEDYHERQEEDFLFPRFEKAGKLTDLVSVLRKQHERGRLITNSILQLARQQNIRADTDQQLLSGWLSSFTRMYRPHEAREDTVLFPALRSIMSRHEYEELGEAFEKNEHHKFGKCGFGQFVEQVTVLERELGIYDLARFTP